MVDNISFPYRSSSHLVMLHVIAESGSWAKHGLDVKYDFPVMMNDAHRVISTGEVEFVSGNHISTYGMRARGDDWVYLGQTVNTYRTKLCVRPDSGIDSIDDLRGKCVGTRGSHPGYNDWLTLKFRGLDIDREDVELVKKVDGEMSLDSQPEDGSVRAPTRRKLQPVWQWVRDGKVDAAFLPPPTSLFAQDAGLKLIDIEPLPMIWFTTISTCARFVAKHPNLVDRFLRGMIEGIHFFKTEREKSIRIIKDRYTKDGELTYEQAAYCWQNTAPFLEPRLYPTMPAILNVYEEAKRQDKDSMAVNPLALWDLHYLRRIDDSGFVDGLYGSAKGCDQSHANDPEYIKEAAAEQERIIKAVKACGHLETEHCGCD